MFLNIIFVDPFYQTGHRSCLMTSRTFQECLKMIQYHDTFYLKKLNLGPRQNLFALARRYSRKTCIRAVVDIMFLFFLLQS